MRSILVVTLIAAGVMGCSSVPKTEDAFRTPQSSIKAPTRVANTTFQETNGVVNLAFDEKGNWVALSTTGTAELNGNSVVAQENAISVAAMRAKRNISEFLNNSMKSTKTVEGVAKSHQKTLTRNNPDSETDDATTRKNDEISETSRQFAQTVNEKIVDSSNAILKGVRITSQQITGDRAVVMLEVSQQSMAAAKSIQHRMTGAMN